MKYKHFFYSLLVLATYTFYSCSGDDSSIGDVENISTCILTFTDSQNNTYEFRAQDTIGNSTVDILEVEPLPANDTLTVTVQVQDDINGINVMNEINAENTEHLFCYIALNNLVALFIDLNPDDNGDNFGSEFRMVTKDPSSGTMRIRLKHKPGKSDNIPCLTGDIDMEVFFPVTIL